MLTTESTKVMAAAKANCVLDFRVNCKAIGVPGIAASSKMPILASEVSGKTLTSRKPMAGIRKQFANSVRTNRARARRILNKSPPLTRSPMENITTATKKLSNGKGRISTLSLFPSHHPRSLCLERLISPLRRLPRPFRL